jgi:hypothetical protein
MQRERERPRQRLREPPRYHREQIAAGHDLQGLYVAGNRERDSPRHTFLLQPAIYRVFCDSPANDGDVRIVEKCLKFMQSYCGRMAPARNRDLSVYKQCFLMESWDFGSPGLMIYIMVDSVESTIDAITANGGEVVPPVGADTPEITARFRDPAGNIIGLYQLR